MKKNTIVYSREEMETQLYLHRGIEYTLPENEDFRGMLSPIVVIHRPFMAHEGHLISATPDALLNSSFQCPICDPESQEIASARIREWLDEHCFAYTEDVVYEERPDLVFDFVLDDCFDEEGRHVVVAINYLDKSWYWNHTELREEAREYERFAKRERILYLAVSHLEAREIDFLLEESLGR